jgi:hypothetical protein
MIALQALGIVIDAQAALDAVGLQLVALAPAERAGLGNVDGHQRQAVRAPAALRKEMLHRMHGRNAPVGLIAAVAAHGFRIGQARKRDLHLESRHLADALDQRLDHLEDALLLREGHLQIDLRKLRLAVGAQVFIAEAAHDLEIFVEAG